MRYRMENGLWFAIVNVEGVRCLAECNRMGIIVRDLGVVKKSSRLRKGCIPKITYYTRNTWGYIDKKYPSLLQPVAPIVEIRRK